jgi:hypothetical protein
VGRAHLTSGVPRTVDKPRVQRQLGPPERGYDYTKTDLLKGPICLRAETLRTARGATRRFRPEHRERDAYARTSADEREGARTSRSREHVLPASAFEWFGVYVLSRPSTSVRVYVRARESKYYLVCHSSIVHSQLATS